MQQRPKVTERVSAVALEPAPRFRRIDVTLILLAAALIVAFVVMLLGTERAGMNKPASVNAGALARSEAWIAANLPRDSGLLTDESMRQDLIKLGYPRERIRSYSGGLKVAAPGAPDAGPYEFVVSTPPSGTWLWAIVCCSLLGGGLGVANARRGHA